MFQQINFKTVRKDVCLIELWNMLKDEYLVVKIGHDRAESEPLKICQESAQS